METVSDNLNTGIEFLAKYTKNFLSVLEGIGAYWALKHSKQIINLIGFNKQTQFNSMQLPIECPKLQKLMPMNLLNVGGIRFIG